MLPLGVPTPSLSWQQKRLMNESLVRSPTRADSMVEFGRGDQQAIEVSHTGLDHNDFEQSVRREKSTRYSESVGDDEASTNRSGNAGSENGSTANGVLLSHTAAGLEIYS